MNELVMDTTDRFVFRTEQSPHETLLDTLVDPDAAEQMTRLTDIVRSEKLQVMLSFLRLFNYLSTLSIVARRRLYRPA